tara:strand:- start:278 stop:1435 length:1158 start_codon:yes stop_codon:yes gene_type:complete
MKRKLRMGMVGGGKESFIGAVHRKAALMDGKIDFVAGALSSNRRKSMESAEELFLSENRSYGSWIEMLDKESKLPQSDRIDFVSIVTPNHTHYPIAKAFLESGFNVVCDKPMTYSLSEAKDLIRIVEKSNLVFALTHNYTGYPMVKQARYMVENGDLGEIIKIIVEYPQGWLLSPIEKKGHKQASWRTDPSCSGVSNCMGDIGSHCENLVNYITRLKIKEVCADIMSIEDRKLDNDGNVLLRFESGASGILHASQISIGEENNLNIRIYGNKGSIEWHQEEPNSMWFKTNDAPAKLYKRGNDYLCESAKKNSRLPAGHPESFIEAFANIYTNAARTIDCKINGATPDEFNLDFPNVLDGARGMAFIESIIESGNSDEKWYPMKEY